MGRLVCPDCLVEVVDDPTATIACRHCGRTCPAQMESCPGCLAELRLDADAVATALGDILSAGGRLYRPEGIPAFMDGPACSVVRLAPRGSMVVLGPEELVEASVKGPGILAVPPLTCRDNDGTVLFVLVVYEAADNAVVAFDSKGAPLATYLRTAGGDRTAEIDVRDETSAPVAALVRRRDGYDLVETGSDQVVAVVETTDVELEGWLDDQWSVRPVATRIPLRPLAVVALALAAKVLLGRPSPLPPDSDPDEPPAWDWT